MKNKTILQYLQENHIALQAMCNGKHQCGQCKVKVLNRQIEINEKEKTLLTKEEVEEGIRLACFHEYQNDEVVVCQQNMDILEEIQSSLNEQYHYSEGIGLIVDIGTTTIVMKWIDRSNGQCVESSSFVNPQVSFGGDVISRIHYQNEHNNTLLHDILIESIETELLQKNKEVNQIVICGNTTMIHFLLGEDVKSLGEAPFIVPKKEMQFISSQTIFKNYPYDCLLITFPHISAYVGGDIVAGILTTQMDKKEEKTLFIDLGTNGEMVVGNKDSLYATSTAAGPAFEGVGISCGGSSIPGAIYEVRLNPLTIQTIQNIEPTCICGSGLISLFSECVKNELIDPIGKLINNKEITITSHIKLNQKDIQNFQLAKAAIQTGVTVLLKQYPVEKLAIAGGFGSHLNINDLKEIKVIPHQIHQIEYYQNSALKGCYILLMTQDFERVKSIANRVKTMNLAEDPDFEDIYLESLYFYD